MFGMDRHVSLDGLIEPVVGQAKQILDLFWQLHMTMIIPAVAGVISGVVPFSVVALVQQRMQIANLVVPNYLNLLVSFFLYAAIPVIALVIFLFKKCRYNSRYDMVAKKIKNTLGEHPEWQEALTVLRVRDGFVDRHAKLIGLK